MLRSRTLRLCLATASALAGLLPLNGHADDFPTVMARVDTASEATVFLVPPMALFRTSLDEAGMQTASCRYATTDPAAIRALAGLLKDGRLATNVVYARPDMREGVYLTLADGARVKLLLQDNHGGKSPVSGLAETFLAGNPQTVSVTGAQTLAVDLRRWAVAYGGTGTGSACNRQTPVADPR